MGLNKEQIKENITGKLKRHFGKTIQDATDLQIYKAVAMTVRDEIMDKWISYREVTENQELKELYYLSVEFLMGRALGNNMLNLMEKKEYGQALAELGFDGNRIEEMETDAGLGNGGLGRLAACFLDSLSSLGLPATGCGIRFEYGLFRQRIVDGAQVELPDNWLQDGYVWEVERPEEQVEVRFGGKITEEWENGKLHICHTGYHSVYAVPYDVPIVGYNSPVVNTLRLWSARSPEYMNMEYFSRGEYIRATEEKQLAEVISKVLYPEDNHYEGKMLRLKQHYFFASATVQRIIRKHKAHYGRLGNLAAKVAIQINDTHPALAIPEMMRILMDEEGMAWEEAEDITRGVFSYTNHTVMSEALEKWPQDMIKDLLPRVYSILTTMNQKLCEKVWAFYPGQWERIGSMAIIAYGQVRMANLSAEMSHSVNGVSQLHADIIKKGIFRDFYVLEPHKFIGITNGITHRRWLINANEGLSDLICEAIGNQWIRQPMLLEQLLPFKDDAAFCKEYDAVKRQNKARLAKWLKEHQGVVIDTDSIFDVQAKRLHEYKRQLMNVLHIIYLYFRIKDNPNIELPNRTFIFGAKSSPGYHHAKQVIKLINAVAKMIERDSAVRGRIRVVFLENYGVSSAEVLIPSAEVSQQISTAGKEASGTGNMKFMMNGALTVGTMDGANVEIFEAVGKENMFIFGLRAEEVERLVKQNEYKPGYIYEKNRELRRVVDSLIDGTVSSEEKSEFSDLFRYLLFGEGCVADPYFVLKDFESYVRTQQIVGEEYANRKEWTQRAIVNTAKSGFFSSDRTIEDYNKLIWHLEAPRS
ncbi:MAG: glycogen/starch/alpha-glucan phosphorylase [Christensenellales bacterium]